MGEQATACAVGLKLTLEKELERQVLAPSPQRENRNSLLTSYSSFAMFVRGYRDVVERERFAQDQLLSQ
jgi:hypothetical protein